MNQLKLRSDENTTAAAEDKAFQVNRNIVGRVFIIALVLMLVLPWPALAGGVGPKRKVIMEYSLGPVNHPRAADVNRNFLKVSADDGTGSKIDWRHGGKNPMKHVVEVPDSVKKFKISYAYCSYIVCEECHPFNPHCLPVPCNASSYGRCTNLKKYETIWTPASSGTTVRIALHNGRLNITEEAK